MHIIFKNKKRANFEFVATMRPISKLKYKNIIGNYSSITYAIGLIKYYVGLLYNLVEY